VTISVSLCDNTERVGSGTTVSGITFGTASPDRVIVILGFTADSALTAATIGGVTATYAQLDIGTTRMAMWWARVPTGTSGDLVCTSANPIYSVGAYALYGSRATIFAGNGSVASSTTLNTPANGAVIGFSVEVPAGTVAWPVLGEDFDRVLAGGPGAGTLNVSGAHLDPTTAQTPMTVQANTASAVVAISFEPSLFIDAAAGSYALTGTAATPKHGWRPTAGAGSYALTGTAATPKHGWRVAADAGSYTLTGANASLLHAWKTVAGAESYTLTGADATLTISANKTVTAGAGSYVLTGSDATPRHAWKPTAGVGSYTITGQTASIVHGWEAVAGAGSYDLTGSDATLTKVSPGAFSIVAGQGSYELSGAAASLVFSGIEEAPADVWWPVFVKRRQEIEDARKLSEAQKNRLVKRAKKKVLEIIKLGPIAKPTLISEAVNEVAPDVSEPDWNEIYRRIEAAATAALLKQREEEEDEEEAMLLLAS
jgi:hypothetical protein